MDGTGAYFCSRGCHDQTKQDAAERYGTGHDPSVTPEGYISTAEGGAYGD